MKRRAFANHHNLPLPHSDSERSRQQWDQFFARIEELQKRGRKK